MSSVAPAYVEGAERARRILCPDERYHLASLTVHLLRVVQEISHQARVVALSHFVSMKHEGIPGGQEPRNPAPPVDDLTGCAR